VFVNALTILAPVSAPANGVATAPAIPPATVLAAPEANERPASAIPKALLAMVESAPDSENLIAEFMSNFLVSRLGSLTGLAELISNATE
jgi:hypothetical protein